MGTKQEKEFDWKKAIQTCYYSNSFLLFLVVALTIFYDIYDIKIMLHLSAVIFVLYIANYFIIAKGHTNLYICMVYGMLTIYMCLATISLGLKYGFHLYCMSIIPIIYIVKYLGYKLNRSSPNPHIMSAMIVSGYVLCTTYTVVYGPVYTINDEVAAVLFAVNSVAVFTFLVAYSVLVVNTVINSDKKLTALAIKDPLTKLYNRRYMSERIDEAVNSSRDTEPWIAMFDIDDFKQINDMYGHSAGDRCILFVRDMLKEYCKGCILSRWGGDEFLILSDGTMQTKVLESLRTMIEATELEENGKKYSITITAGIAKRGELSSEDWISLADKRLYHGKFRGKNRICEEDY